MLPVRKVATVACRNAASTTDKMFSYNAPMRSKENGLLFGLLAATVAGGGAYAYYRPGRQSSSGNRLERAKAQGREEQKTVQTAPNE
ncbi:unnamed protein product, partial [Mesorhabditis spiculigera]